MFPFIATNRYCTGRFTSDEETVCDESVGTDLPIPLGGYETNAETTVEDSESYSAVSNEYRHSDGGEFYSVSLDGSAEGEGYHSSQSVSSSGNSSYSKTSYDYEAEWSWDIENGATFSIDNIVRYPEF